MNQTRANPFHFYPPWFTLCLPLLLLLGCTPNYSADTYASTAVQQASKVEQGVIVGVRKVAVQASGATGGAAGAAAGGLTASQLPGGPVSSALSTLGGTLVGGLVGSGIERAAGDTTALEYIVRKGSGELVSVTQKDDVPLAIGQKVLVIAGSQARIVADYTVPTEPPPAGATATVPAGPTYFVKPTPPPETAPADPMVPAP